MNPFNKVTSYVAPFDRSNIDTDTIVPKEFLTSTNRATLGEVLFNNWRYTNEGKENESFVLNKEPYRTSSILIARKNFGSGSSREHAPWALYSFGFKVLLASSFADIFYNNCFKTGILPIMLPEQTIANFFNQIEKKGPIKLSINLETMKIISEANHVIKFDISSHRRKMLLDGLDDIGFTLQSINDIEEFEEKHIIYYNVRSGL